MYDSEDYLDADHAGLGAWVDPDGTFYAVGADDVARAYGDGPHEGRRLRADLLDSGAPGATLDLAPFRYDPPAWAEEAVRQALTGRSPSLIVVEECADFDRVSVEQDPIYRWINTASLAVAAWFVVYIACHFVAAWLGGRL